MPNLVALLCLLEDNLLLFGHHLDVNFNLVVQLHAFLLQFDDFLLEIDEHGAVILVLSLPFVDLELEGVYLREEITDVDLVGRSFVLVGVAYLLYFIHKFTDIFVLPGKFFLQMRNFLLMLFCLHR